MPETSEKLNAGMLVAFDRSSADLPRNPTLEQLCVASRKDARLWARPEIYDDLMESFKEQCDIRPGHRLLEVGCAAGFLAVGLSKMCRQYVGIDLAPLAIRHAHAMQLPHAEFRVADGATLPFPDGSFDRVVCYDVVTNFPDVEMARVMAEEMIRVTADGGRCMIGAVPNKDSGQGYFDRARQIVAELDARYGPRVNAKDAGLPWLSRLRHWYIRRVKKVDLTLANYLFDRKDFISFGNHCKVRTEILPSHKLSPWGECRFNVLYLKSSNESRK